jgi:hypothetical protein
MLTIYRHLAFTTLAESSKITMGEEC